MTKIYHQSVLLQETIDALRVQKGEKYIDATLGGGGHTGEILRLGGEVLGIDQDEDAIQHVRENFKFQISNFKLKVARENFEKIEEIAKENGYKPVAGVLFDLGISSHHIEEGERGFSFLKEAPLDMRMDRAITVTASDLVNGLNKGELIQLLTKYGEEVFAKRIASAILKEREYGPITTTTQLAKVIASVIPGKNHTVHPATKSFQALRIAVNDELYVLDHALPQALSLLTHNGRLVVISFHSLEARIVKRTFIEWEKKGLGKIITDTPITPQLQEIEENKRSRSSQLRVFEKI